MANENAQSDDRLNDASAVAEIDVILAEMDFPASRDDLVSEAEESEADSAVVLFFETLPNREYSSGEEVRQAAAESRQPTGGQQQSNDQRQDRT